MTDVLARIGAYKRGEIAARLDATADEARLAAAIEAALKPPAKGRAPTKAS